MRAIYPIVFSFVGLVLPLFCYSAVPKKPMAAAPNPNILYAGGVLRGGEAGFAFSILDIRRSAAVAKKTERIVIDLGDGGLQPHLGKPAYYTIELKEKPQRLFIDLAQTMSSKIDDKKLKQIFAKSLLVQDSRVFFEPGNQTMSLSFDLKRPIFLRVTPVAGRKNQSAKLVIDISERM